MNEHGFKKCFLKPMVIVVEEYYDDYVYIYNIYY